MKTKSIKLGTALFTLAAGILAVRAQDNPQNESPWWGRLGISYRAAFNISASFTGLGGYTSMNTPGVPGPTPTTGGPGTVERTYDDGFIGVDISGNAGGTTTYWGFNSDAQVVNGNVLMHNSSSPATASTGDVGNDPQNGIEVSYYQPLGGKDRWRWGMEGAFNWTPIDIQDSQMLAGNVVTVTHAYALNGVVAPVTPPAYVGPVNGPGAPQLSTDAMAAGTTTQAGAVAINGWRKVDADLYGVRIGPYVEYDLFKRVNVDLSGGFSTGIMDSRFDYNDVTTIPGLGSQTSAGSDRSCGWVYGGYVRGQVNVRLYRSAVVFAGAELNSLSDFTQSSGSAHAELNLGSAVYVTVGLGWNF
jgi:hypothetical protein